MATSHKGYVTMRNADGDHKYIGDGAWALNWDLGSFEELMTFQEFLDDDNFSDEIVLASREDSHEYGIYSLAWHSIPLKGGTDVDLNE